MTADKPADPVAPCGYPGCGKAESDPIHPIRGQRAKTPDKHWFEGFRVGLAPAPQPEPLRAALDDDPGGEHCNECGQPVWVWWHAPDDLWAAVTGRVDGGGLRCIRCFDRAATEQGHLIEWRPIFHDHRGRPTYFFDLVRPHLTRRADSRAVELLRELADEVGRETISGNKRVHMGAWLRARNFLDSLKESGAVPASGEGRDDGE